MRINAKNEPLRAVILFDRPALFADVRIDRATVPEGWYCYDLRGSDYDPNRPVTVENFVVVNHAGSVLTLEPIQFPNGTDYRMIHDELNFLGEEMTLAEFRAEYSRLIPEKSSASVIGRMTYANGDIMTYRDADEFIRELLEELPYRDSTGMRYEVLSNDPAVRKSVDDALYSLTGEQNPRSLEDYAKPGAAAARHLRPASPEEAGLFYAQSPEKDAELGAIGHVRIDFGKSGTEFWHTWHPRGSEELNSPEFRAELGQVVDELRKKDGPLESMSGMKKYCSAHGGAISGGWEQNYGFVIETDQYQYLLRCNPVRGDYNAYLNCFSKRIQEMNMEQQQPNQDMTMGGMT